MNAWHQVFMSDEYLAPGIHELGRRLAMMKIVTHQVPYSEHVTDVLAMVAEVPGAPLYQAIPSDTRHQVRRFARLLPLLLFVEAADRVEQCRQHVLQLHTTHITSHLNIPRQAVNSSTHRRRK